MKTKRLALTLLAWTGLLMFSGCDQIDEADTAGTNQKDTAAEYFVSTDGNDSADGTFDAPFQTLQKALSVVKPGERVYLRGGSYPVGVTISVSGTEDEPITIESFQEEKVVFVGPYGEDKIYDTDRNLFDDSLVVLGNWLILKDFEVKNAAQGMYVGGGASHNRFENLSLHDNYWGGLILTDGAAYNTVINCDAYRNYDANTHGQHADGFDIRGRSTDTIPYVGEGNRFVACRSWENADDGYDCWEAGNAIVFIDCLAYDNGNNIWDDDDFQGDGNGFKLGIHNRDGYPRDRHEVIGCKAWKNAGWGFDSNDNIVGMEIRQNVAWDNRLSFKFIYGPHHLIENVSIDSGVNYIDGNATEENNSWNGVAYTIESFDDTAIRGDRDRDGNVTVDGFLEVL